MEIKSSNFAAYINPGEYQKLGRHINRKHINEKSWLGALIQSWDPKHFPYRLSNKKYGPMENRTTSPKSQNFLLPSCRGKRPLYLINMPFVPPQSRDYASFNRAANKICDESFGKTAKFSRRIIERRAALVVGMNRYKSLDEAENRRFCRYVRELPKKNDLPLRVIGKLWVPVWTQDSESKNNIYCPWKSFKLLKVLKPQPCRQSQKNLRKVIALSQKTNSLSSDSQLDPSFQSHSKSGFPYAEFRKGKTCLPQTLRRRYSHTQRRRQG